MISPYSELTTFDQIRFFNISRSDIDKDQIFKLIGPIDSLLKSDLSNSIYVFKDGENIHVEALIQTKTGLSKTQTVGTSIKEAFNGLVPQLLKNIASKGLYRGSLKLVG